VAKVTIKVELTEEEAMALRVLLGNITPVITAACTANEAQVKTLTILYVQLAHIFRENDD